MPVPDHLVDSSWENFSCRQRCWKIYATSFVLFISRELVGARSGWWKIFPNKQYRFVILRIEPLLSLSLSLFSRSNLSSFRKIDWKNSYRIFVVNLYENSYRRNWNSFRLFLLLSTNISLDERRFRAEWINLVTNIFNKIGYSTKCWKNIKGFLIFFIDRSIYEKVVWWSIREISFLLWNILAAISILS